VVAQETMRVRTATAASAWSDLGMKGIIDGLEVSIAPRVD
jgi:hypothetical protein